MNYAYIRVSTHEQELDAQREAVKKYCESKSLDIPNFYEDSVSGFRVHWTKRKLSSLIELAKKDDLLIFPEISRISRVMLEILEVIKILTEKKVKVHILKPEFILDDGLNSKLLVFVFGFLSEVERTLISQRTIEGLRAAELEGRKGGRRVGCKSEKVVLDEYAEDIIRYLRGNISKSDIVRLINMKRENTKTTRTTLVRWLKRYEIPLNSTEVGDKEYSQKLSATLAKIKQTNAKNLLLTK